MFEVGFSELLLIMGLALLVLGPEKLPKVVSEIGRWMGRARAMARQFREQLEDESIEFGKRQKTSASSSSTAASAPPTAASPVGSGTTTPTLEDVVQQHAEAAVPDHVPQDGDASDLPAVEPAPAAAPQAAPVATESATSTDAAASTATDQPAK